MRKIGALIFLIFFFCCGFNVVLAAGKEAEKYNKEGMDYLEEGKLDEALEKFNTAISLEPNYAVAIQNRAVATYFIGENDVALEDYLKAISIDPSLWQSYIGAAQIYLERDELLYAVEYCEKAMKANSSPDAALIAYIKLAFIYSYMGDSYKDPEQYESACEAARKALEINPQSVVAYYNLGYSLYKQDKPDDAIANLNKAIEIDPSYAGAYHILGSIYYDKAVKLNREFVDTESQEAMEEAPKMYGEAEKYFRKVLELDPDNAKNYRFYLGNIYFGLTEDDKALEEYRIAIELAREQNDMKMVKDIQNQIKVIQELKENREQGGNK